MKDLQVTRLPKCDFCNSEEGIYDAPTKQGPWANMCKDCYPVHKNGAIGTKRVLKVIQKSDNPDKVVKGIEESSEEYIQSIIIEGELRSITCPECGMDRHVEPDATYAYKCECGVKVKVEDIMMSLL